jgi:hypothetical protein
MISASVSWRIGGNRLRAAFLAEVRQDQQRAGQPLFARIAELSGRAIAAAGPPVAGRRKGHPGRDQGVLEDRNSGRGVTRLALGDRRGFNRVDAAGIVKRRISRGRATLKRMLDPPALPPGRLQQSVTDIACPSTGRPHLL